MTHFQASQPTLAAQLQRGASFGHVPPEKTRAVTNLLELASTPDYDTHASAIHALNILGTNSWPVLPRLDEMLAREQDEKRRKVIAHAIEYISGSGPSIPRKE